MRAIPTMFVAAALVIVALPATATRIRRVSLEEMRDRADAVIVAEVLGSSTRNGEASAVWTDYQVRLVETLKGGDQPAVRTVSFLGGSTGDRDMGVDGVPKLTSGRTYVFFLNANGQKLAAPTVGWGQGLYRVEEATVASRRTQLLVSYDGEPLQLDAHGRLFRGTAVRVERGALEEITRSAASTNRIAASSMIHSDGSTTPAPPSRRAAASTPSVRRFASLAQLRDFVAGRLQSGEVPTTRLR